MVLGLSWAVWAVMTAPDLDEIAGGWLGQDATVSSVPLVGQLPWLGIMLALAAYAIWQGVSRWKVAVHRKIRPCFGLFAGWLSMIIVAEALAFSAMHAGNPDSLMFKGTSALAVILLGLFLSAISFKNPMGIYLNAGALWVLSCIIIDRYSGHATSPLFATVCLVAAVLMLICLVSALRTRIQRILSSH